MSALQRNFTTLLAAFLLTLATATAGPITYSVSINTGAIAGMSGYFLDLQLNPGDITSPALTAVIASFDMSTGSLAGAPSPLGDVTGTLPPAVTIGNSTPLNSYFDGFTAGPTISFLLTLSGPAIDAPSASATAGSSFAVLMYDSGYNPILTVDPNGILGRVDIGLDGAPSLVYFSESGTGPSAITFTLDEQPPSATPEPATAALAGVFLVALWTGKRWRRSS